jgi:uroporphyrinogen-III synthase
MRLILTRPAEDNESLSRKLENLGHQVAASPLLEIVANVNIKIPLKPWAAILITSANGIRNLPSGLVRPDTRLIAVGAQSAQAARACGFQNVESQGGDVERLGAWITQNLSPASGPLLYLTGKEISGDLAGLLSQQRFEIDRIETYQAQPRPLILTRDEIADCDGVLLYSPRSAKLWLNEIEARGFTDVAALLQHYCLSPAVSKILPQNWRLSVASEPTESALLQLLE